MAGTVMELWLGRHRQSVEAAASSLLEQRVVDRIWERDFRLWQASPQQVSDRMAWLEIPDDLEDQRLRYTSIRRKAKAAGLRHVTLLGMGGSSLAPEMLAEAFGPGQDGLSLSIVDSTHPEAIRKAEAVHDPGESLYIVASKSGGTVETLSLARYFFGRVAELRGVDRAGQQFVAITDPGSTLEQEAKGLGFLDIVHGEPEIGGRFSALSPFGLLPASLLGLDIDALTQAARLMAASGRRLPAGEFQGAKTLEDNPAAMLGLTMAVLAQEGRDKLTLILPERIASLGDWIEQLVAESTGKHGGGILPVLDDEAIPASDFGDDRFFVAVEFGSPEPRQQARLEALRFSEHPCCLLKLDDLYALGAQLFLWEFATAIAGWRLAVNPFDQPNVEAAKAQARALVSEYYASGRLDEPEPSLVEDDGCAIYAQGELDAGSCAEAMWQFLDRFAPDASYLAIHAWLSRDSENAAALERFRSSLARATGLATTMGFGPRFLHSTGQLHKGDGGRGLFIQLTAETGPALAIPDGYGADASTMDFGLLMKAQALGDAAALRDAGRKLLRIHLGASPASTIRELSDRPAGSSPDASGG